MPAAASPPVGSPPQYSPALRWVTTGFGMGPGGASTLSATGTPHPRHAGGRGAPCCARAAGSAPHAPVRSPARPVQQHRPLTVPAPGVRPPPGEGSPAVRRGLPLGEEGLPSRWREPPRCRATTPDRNTMQVIHPRPLGRLGSSRLPAVHLPPINPVICRGSYLHKSGDARLGEGFPLRCFQRFARPHVATQRCRSRDNWHTSGASTPVLSY